MRLLSLLTLLIATTTLLSQSNKFDQQWVGLHNLAIKNASQNSSSELIPGDSTVLVLTESSHKEFSFGLWYRKAKGDGWYEQIDLLQIDRSMREDLTQVVRTDLGISEPTRGEERKEFQALTAYQRGKVFPVLGNLQADIGARTFFAYQTVEQTPRTSLGFPVNQKSISLGLNLEVGLQFRIFNNWSIGYHVVPFTGRLFHQTTDTENPIIPREQRREKNTGFATDTFDNLLDTRNIHLSYIF